jgi:hypothetical protein
MHAYTYLETCVQKDMTLGAMESASPDKSGGTVAAFAASDNNGVDDADGFLRMKSLAELHLSVDPAVDDELFAAAVPNCCSEKFIRLVLLRFKQCAPSRFIRRIHA